MNLVKLNLVKYLFSVVHEDRCITIVSKENTLSSTFDGNVSVARVIITLLTIYIFDFGHDPLNL